MKRNQGITLMSLVIYVVVMTLVLVVISSIIEQFYQNTDSLEADTEEILQWSQFNAYFLKETKMRGNQIDSLAENYIVFKTGNSFYYNNHKIYYNNQELCNEVTTFTITQGESEDIVIITLGFENFTKTIAYKIEEID